jgi:hypothetical protein
MIESELTVQNQLMHSVILKVANYVSDGTGTPNISTLLTQINSIEKESASY